MCKHLGVYSTRENNIVCELISPRIYPKFSACVCFLYSLIGGKVEGRESVDL